MEPEKEVQVVKPTVAGSAANRRKSPERLTDQHKRLDSGKLPRPDPVSTQKGRIEHNPQLLDNDIKAAWIFHQGI